MRNKDANLTDLVNLVAERTGISVNKTKGIVAEVLQGVIQLTEDHGALAIRSFGRFDKRVRRGRSKHKTAWGAGESTVPTRELIHFTLSKQLIKDVADE